MADTASPMDGAAALKGWGHRGGGHHRQRGGVVVNKPQRVFWGKDQQTLSVKVQIVNIFQL